MKTPTKQLTSAPISLSLSLSLLTGFVAGVVVTAKSRNPRLMVMSGIGNAAIFSAMELFLGGMH